MLEQEDLSLLKGDEKLVVNDPIVRRYGLQHEVLREYRSNIKQGYKHHEAMWHACMEWDV